MKRFGLSCVLLVLFVLGCVGIIVAQKAKPKTTKAPRPIIFAVRDNGKILEPIAYINKSKLENTISGDDDSSLVTAFTRIYYKPGTTYRLVFGSADSGIVKVISSNANADCGKNFGAATTNVAKLKGLVMGLATNSAVKTRPSLRRKPTAAERIEIEALARSEFAKHKLVLPEVDARYHNLTALDLENDGTAEFVGSYWIEIDPTTRGLLFFIAGKGSSGKYTLGFSEYRMIDQEKDVMSKEIKHVDEGTLHELLLDAFDYDGDGISNIFTYTQSFEGAGFNAYSKSGGKWVRSFEGSNYHCAY